MGKKSIKENKTKYQIARENLGLTRAEASELTGYTESQLERIENRKLKVIPPEDALNLSKAYKDHSICNYYCTHDCEIGKQTMHEVKEKEISQIAVETLTTLNQLNQKRDRLLEIIADGVITEDEEADFQMIKDTLDRIVDAAAEMKLWYEKVK